MVLANLAERRKQEGKEKAGQTDAWSHGYICLGRTGGERIQATSACTEGAQQVGIDLTKPYLTGYRGSPPRSTAVAPSWEESPWEQASSAGSLSPSFRQWEREGGRREVRERWWWWTGDNDIVEGRRLEVHDKDRDTPDSCAFSVSWTHGAVPADPEYAVFISPDAPGPAPPVEKRTPRPYQLLHYICICAWQ